MKKITLTEIAKLAGVSQQTASAVLSDSKKDNTRFSKATAEKIREIAEEHDYRPRRTPRALFEKKHRSIGLLARTLTAITHTEMMAVLQCTAEMGQTVLIDMMKDGEILPLTIREDIVDGLLIFEDLGDEIDSVIDRYQIPAVYVNANMHDCKSSTVNMDEKGAMRMALETFVRSGKSRPLLLQQGVDSFSRLRDDGLKEACTARGLKEPVILTIAEPVTRRGNILYREYVRQEVRPILAKHPDIDSIISVFRDTTIAAYQLCKEMNRSIPDDIAVISLHSVSKEWMLTPMITCLDIDRYDMAAKGVELLHKTINKERRSNIMLEYTIFEGDST